MQKKKIEGSLFVFFHFSSLSSFVRYFNNLKILYAAHVPRCFVYNPLRLHDTRHACEVLGLRLFGVSQSNFGGG